MTYRDLLAAVRARYGWTIVDTWFGGRQSDASFYFRPLRGGRWLMVDNMCDGNVRLERSDGTSQVVPAASAMPFLEAFAAEVLANELG